MKISRSCASSGPHPRYAFVLSVLVISLSPLPAQNVASEQSPVDVVRAYRKIDIAGGRLTADGWYKASTFFMKPARPPQHRAVTIIHGERVQEHARVKGNRAEVDVWCDVVGQIDSSARLTFMVAPSLIDSQTGRTRIPEAGTQPITGPDTPVMRVYQLIQTETHWEFGPKGEGPREVKGNLEWRLEYFEYQPVITIDVAIRYLTSLREESRNEIVKSNADKSIATLRGLR